jgi:hypothetical protein
LDDHSLAVAFVARLVFDVKTDGLEFPFVPNVKGDSDVLRRGGDTQIDLADGESQAFDPCKTFTRTRIKPNGLPVSVFDARRRAVDQNPSLFVALARIADKLSQVEFPLPGSRRADPNTDEKY